MLEANLEQEIHPGEVLQEIPHKLNVAAHQVSDAAAHAVSGAVHTTTETLHEIQNRAKHAAEVTTKALHVPIDQTAGAIHTLQEKTVSAGGLIQEKVVNAGESFQEAAIATADAIHDKAIKVGETIAEKASAAGERVVHAAESLVDKADAASDKAVHAAEAIAHFAAGAAHTIAEKASAVVEGAKAVVEAIKERTADFQNDKQRPGMEGGFLHKGHKHPISHVGGVDSGTWAPDSEAPPALEEGVELKDLAQALKPEEVEEVIKKVEDLEVIPIDDLPKIEVPTAPKNIEGDSNVVYERIYVNTNNVAEAIDAIRVRAMFEETRAGTHHE
jgi:hypothetical protein